MIKLIAIDLDGTLLNSEKKIPKENISAIQAAAQAGVKSCSAQDAQNLALCLILNNWG